MPDIKNSTHENSARSKKEGTQLQSLSNEYRDSSLNMTYGGTISVGNNHSIVNRNMQTKLKTVYRLEDRGKEKASVVT